MLKLMQPRWIFTLTVCVMFFTSQESSAHLPPLDDVEPDTTTMYDNLLQREFAGPALFPNHQVERKAQRSPSLRLRFGRRGDPEFMSMIEKRWFGDVNQKPIRSPSLRLRFGRRSDPAMPLQANYDMVMSSDLPDNSLESYPDEDVFERIIRKPQRLRFGRSLNYDTGFENNIEDEFDREEELVNAEKLRQLTMTLRQMFDAIHDYNKENDDQYSRQTRKNTPSRLRFGRSFGDRNTLLAEDKKLNEQTQPEVLNKA